MAKLRIRTGSEGPAHDPYGWEEVDFTSTTGDRIVFRFGGLGYERTFFNGVKVAESFGLASGEKNSQAEREFEWRAGFNPYRAQRILDNRERRRLRRMSRREREQYEDWMDAERRMLSYAM